MDKHFVYKTANVCANEICFDYVDGRVWNVEFHGGCKGNTQGVAALAEGMKGEDIIRRVKGLDCHGGHSCPDEFSKAVKACMEECAANA